MGAVEKWLRRAGGGTAACHGDAVGMAADREPPIGRVYVPTASYAEMGEWALPPDETAVFGCRPAPPGRCRKRPEARWLRGGSAHFR